MSEDHDSRSTSKRESGAFSGPLPTKPPKTIPDSDLEKKSALAAELDRILGGIPFIGPYLVIARLKWGWAGIFLLIVGFMAASLLVVTGYFPAKLASKTCKSPTLEYELKTQDEINWEAEVKKAKIRIWASGVALTKLNPQSITAKVEQGVQVQMTYVYPCKSPIEERMRDERNPNAAKHIKANLDTFKTYMRNPNEPKKGSLVIRLSKVYPTIVVIIIDNDLYAYFCPYGAVCSNSPVLVFKDYFEKQPKSAAATFFENHFLAVCKDATQIPDFDDPCSPPPDQQPENPQPR